MRFWIREIAGWLLVALGLVVFYLCLGMLSARNAQGDPAPMILEVGPVVVIGVIVFRGGIHLLKVAVAARICLEAQKRLGGAATAAPATASRPNNRRELVPPRS